MTDTPETDNCVKERKHMRFLEEDHWVIDRIVTYTHPIVALCRKLERERDEAREQRDAFIKEIEIANERLRGKKHPDDNGIMVDGEIDIKQLLEQRDGLKSAADCASDLLYITISQRDALVTALQQCKEDSIELLGERFWYKDEPRDHYKERYDETQNNIARADAALATVKTTKQND
jgi:hypothetical protein